MLTWRRLVSWVGPSGAAAWSVWRRSSHPVADPAQDGREESVANARVEVEAAKSEDVVIKEGIF